MDFPKTTPIPQSNMTTINFWNVPKVAPAVPVPVIPRVKNFVKTAISSPNPSFPPQCFNGSQLTSLYNITPVAPTTVTTKTSKIGIIIAFTYPNLLKDLATYWKNNINYGPASTPPRVNIYTMPGATQNAGWAQEECLDVQMVCTVNPKANIWVVESRSDSIIDIIAAINYAVNILQCDVISMSFGTNDVAVNTQFNTHFSPTKYPNVCFCAASGDTNTVSWPAVLPSCIAVGGTSLLWTPNQSASNQRTEFTWNGAGCGYSATIAQPAFQLGVANILHTRRAIPDVSLIANPNTGVYTVYAGQWYSIGGTSVATPIFAGMMSLANQQRFNKNKSALTSVTLTAANSIQKCLYNTILPSATQYKSAFNDVTIGTDQGSSIANANALVTYSAITGWDLTTGMGSPNCGNLCGILAQLL